MKTHTKKFRAIIHDGLPQEGWHEEQIGETLLPDDALAFEADTLDELRSALLTAGITVPEVPGEPEQPVYTQQDYEDALEARLDREAQATPYLWRSIDRAVSFAGSDVGKYRAEACYFIELRDVCWTLFFSALENPPAVKPTPTEFAEVIVAQALVNVGRPIYT